MKREPSCCAWRRGTTGGRTTATSGPQHRSQEESRAGWWLRTVQYYLFVRTSALVHQSTNLPRKDQYTNVAIFPTAGLLLLQQDSGTCSLRSL